MTGDPRVAAGAPGGPVCRACKQPPEFRPAGPPVGRSCLPLQGMAVIKSRPARSCTQSQIQPPVVGVSVATCCQGKKRSNRAGGARSSRREGVGRGRAGRLGSGGARNGQREAAGGLMPVVRGIADARPLMAGQPASWCRWCEEWPARSMPLWRRGFRVAGRSARRLIRPFGRGRSSMQGAARTLRTAIHQGRAGGVPNPSSKRHRPGTLGPRDRAGAAPSFFRTARMAAPERGGRRVAVPAGHRFVVWRPHAHMAGRRGSRRTRGLSSDARAVVGRAGSRRSRSSLAPGP